MLTYDCTLEWSGASFSTYISGFRHPMARLAGARRPLHCFELIVQAFQRIAWQIDRSDLSLPFPSQPQAAEM